MELPPAHHQACFLGAVQLMAKRMGRPNAVSDAAVVHANVHLGDSEGSAGLAIAVDIKVEGVDEEVVQAAHAVRRFLIHIARLKTC
jgi:organic hydroperoxide reductase OsmC/OhrA